MENIQVEETIEKVVSKLVEKRKEKGFSLENMAHELGLSVSAYNKIEKQETKLTFERLLQIQILLDVPFQELLDIKGEVYNQHLSDQSIGYQAGVQHLHQENKEIMNEFIKSLQEEIIFLKTLIQKGK
jgi:transcriptional regulator with XRE-family HTH domain